MSGAPHRDVYNYFMYIFQANKRFSENYKNYCAKNFQKNVLKNLLFYELKYVHIVII